MLINLQQTILDYKGEEVTEEVSEKNNDTLNISIKPLTLKSSLLTALNNMSPNEVLSVEDKIHANALSLKIWNSTEVNQDFTAEDIVFMKNRVGIIWNSPTIYVAICDILDGKVNQKVNEPATLASEEQMPEGQ